MLNVFCANANGLKNKVESLKSNIQKLKIGIFTVQESNFVKKGKLKLDRFEVTHGFVLSITMQICPILKIATS